MPDAIDSLLLKNAEWNADRAVPIAVGSSVLLQDAKSSE
jgi:hypothetical protein